MTVQALPAAIAAKLDYLQRTGYEPPTVTAGALRTRVPDGGYRLLHVRRIGRSARYPVGSPDHRSRLLGDDLLAGLYGYKIPVAFSVVGSPAGVAVRLGVWSPGTENAAARALDERAQILASLLRAAYPAIDLAPVTDAPARWPKAGLVLGVPSVRSADPWDGALPIDRLLRARIPGDWGVLVLAQPVDEGHVAFLRQGVFNELRSVDAEMRGAGQVVPAAQLYLELLEAVLASLTAGQAVGIWRTGVYLLGDATSYYRLGSLWRAIFTGDESLPQPLHQWDRPEVADLAAQWALPDPVREAAPGYYAHPFQHQSALTSAQLAAYVHLPSLQTPGFDVAVVPGFDASPPRVTEADAVRLGTVLRAQEVLSADGPAEAAQPAGATGAGGAGGAAQSGPAYLLGRDALGHHAFVAGTTGSGKTNTVFRILRSVPAMRSDALPDGVPFLVIEPAKAEYRRLLRDPALAGRLCVFTPGNENVSPLRVNPFEVVAWPRTPVGLHLDLLRSVFTASFGMWTPLPQILERCLHRVYEDRGWDLATNANPRLVDGQVVPAAFPVLSDLLATVDEVTRELGYEEKISADMRAALRTRLEALRTGGKGRMLDVERSFPMEWLLAGPTVVELEGMGDDDDKAFMMGLLLVRLYEYRRAQGERPALEHLVVIEEAHRLLANPSGGRREEEADPRGKAVEVFANLLAEIAAYGQSIVVVDQIPVKLAPDVIKNTNLKVVQRVVAADDQMVLAGAMAMDEYQAKGLATLHFPQAAVFGARDDAPVLVAVPEARRDLGTTPPDAEIADHMLDVIEQGRHAASLSASTACADVCAPTGRACAAARRIVESAAFRREFARTALSLLGGVDALERTWSDLESTVDALRPPAADRDELFRSVMAHAAHRLAYRRGARAGWSYPATEELAARLRRVLLARLTGAGLEPAWGEFHQLALQLHVRRFEAFPACAQICDQAPPMCLYRHAVADLVSEGSFAAVWEAARAKDEQMLADATGDGERDEHAERERSAGNRPASTWKVCQDAAWELIESTDRADVPEETRRRVNDAAWRTAMCFAQQMLARDPISSPRYVRRVLDTLL